MKKIFALFSLLFVFSASDFSQSTAPETDFQFWNETQVVIPLKKSEDKKTDRISLIFYGTLRFGKNLRAIIDERIGFGFEFKLNKYLTVTPNYLYHAEQPVVGRKNYESRYRLDVGLEKKFKSFTLRDRNRVEHRVRYSRADSTRYRNRFQILFPVKKNDREIFAPFVSTEPFYEFQTKHWTRNELSFGIAKKFNSNVSADFFYMLQNNRGSVLRYVNVAGVNLKFKLD